jgi:hypothetical protein
MICNTACIAAADRASDTPCRLTSPVGLSMISTPRNPMRTAPQRYFPTLSFKKKYPRTGIMSDEVNKKAAVSAIGIAAKAAKVKTRLTVPPMERRTIPFGLLRIVSMSFLPMTKIMKSMGSMAMKFR